MLTCFFINILFTFCPTYSVEPVYKEFIGVYSISRYYSPIPGQKSYYLNRTYEKDLSINTSGDPLVTASGKRMSQSDVYKVVACPSNLRMKTKLYIEGVGNVTCEDRGGAIKGKRIDLWVGIGEQGLNSMYRESVKYAGKHDVYIIK